MAGVTLMAAGNGQAQQARSDGEARGNVTSVGGGQGETSDETDEEFLTKHERLIFSLLGAIAGGVLTFLYSWALSKREYNLRLWDKLIERRIRAHENVIGIAIEMRVMVALGGVEQSGESARAPQILASRDEFERWRTRFAQVAGEAGTWLTTDAKRELNLVQDYLVTLYHHLEGVPSQKYLAVGQIIRSDFITLSSELEKNTFEFFGREVERLRPGNLREWHKYERPETERRLGESILLSQWEDIKARIES